MKKRSRKRAAMGKNIEVYESRIHMLAHQQEYTRIIEFIEDVERGMSNIFFLNLFAPKDFGKAALIELLWECHESTLPVSLVRVADFHRESDQGFALCELLVKVINDISFRLPRRVISLPPGYENLEEERQLADMIFQLISGAKRFKKIVLLLISDYDLIPEDHRRWFQREILNRSALERNVAVILTSEVALRFENLEIRMRLENLELLELDPKIISQVLPKYAELATKIYRITGGLPVLIEDFVEQLETSQVATSADFQAHSQELVEKYYRAYVEEKVLASLASTTRKTLLTLSLLRRFDVKVLRELLPQLLPDSYQDYGVADYLDLIDRMQSWVQWRRQGGYMLNPAFRIMLQGYTLTIKPDLYERVNRVIVSLYQKWLEREYREHYLIELLYHILVLHRFNEKCGLFPVQDEMNQATLVEELQEYLPIGDLRRLGEVELDSLRNSLEQDPDLKDRISGEFQPVIENLVNGRVEGAY
ncbi:MAG: hypothetical protein GF309_01065 [Candidatus Lokiarchaeota archaeon]|nr:hypothetical protein [Candidatus Lokiarchaeota archaeon]